MKYFNELFRSSDDNRDRFNSEKLREAQISRDFETFADSRRFREPGGERFKETEKSRENKRVREFDKPKFRSEKHSLTPTAEGPVGLYD